MLVVAFKELQGALFDILQFWQTKETDRVQSIVPLSQVLPVPQGYLYAHHQLLDEFKNATAWPKHLLVEYSWTTEHTVDALSALYVVFFLCMRLSTHPMSSAGQMIYEGRVVNAQIIVPPEESIMSVY